MVGSLLTLIVASSAMAHPRFAESDRQWVGDNVRPRSPPAYETHSVVVLGVHPDRPWIAYRHLVKHSTSEGGQGIDCDYAGLDDVSGVQLGVFDLEQGQNLYAWWIYEPAQLTDYCLAPEISTQRLARAKATFADLGIDISKPPAPASLASVGLEAKESAATQLTPQPEYRRHRRSLWRGSKELYVREYQDFHPNYHKITFGAAYVVGARHFVVECVYDGIMYRGGVNHCTFTPPLP